MKIVIRKKNIKPSQSLESFIEKKFSELEKFSGKPSVGVWVEISKTTLHHEKGNIFRAECQMRFPRKGLRAEALSHNLRLAVTEVKDELQRQLKQYKNKVIAKTRKRQRRIKKQDF